MRKQPWYAIVFGIVIGVPPTLHLTVHAVRHEHSMTTGEMLFIVVMYILAIALILGTRAALDLIAGLAAARKARRESVSTNTPVNDGS